tara:strand:- start:1986 stop:2297 length:312 start_codon:yes stop_codon:yes gene_type:complete
MQQRWFTLALLTLIAGAWSLALGVLGVWLIMETHAGVLSSTWVSMSAGLVSLCAAQLVFLMCVVDRVFPRPHGLIRVLLESGNALILAGSTLVLIPAALIASV